jgi:hypothetical protein
LLIERKSQNRSGFPKNRRYGALPAGKAPYRKISTKKGSKTGRFGCHGETLWRNAHFCTTSAQGINALDADIETFEKLPELFAESVPDFI